MDEARMWKCECGREFNAAKLGQCPACGRATNAGGPPAVTPSPTSPISTRPVHAASAGQAVVVQPAQAGRATQLRAEQVDTLGGIVVFFAWFVGVVSAGGGLLYALASMNKPVQLISALTFALIGLVQAVFLALIGRYAQLRAAQATNR